MAEKKNWGSTVAGWFIVQEPSGEQAEMDAPASVTFAEDEAAIRRASAPLENVFTSAPPPAPGGNVDFDQVFQAAGIDAEERERVKRTLDLLNSLPPGTDETVRKQIVSASLRAFNVPIEKIIEAGAAELEALEAYIRNGAADTEKVSSEAEQRIKHYEQEIVKLRTVMQQRVEEQHVVIRNCNTKKLEVQKVLEFFGQEAVARVVRDSPRLHEPKA
ncbi:MAG TPA: hypothetical protein VMS98_00860 [Thermoanaerobaculia bacterium]|nr:hypothetical protein [Thermoanaerobaculia bacterium]